MTDGLIAYKLRSILPPYNMLWIGDSVWLHGKCYQINSWNSNSVWLKNGSKPMIVKPEEIKVEIVPEPIGSTAPVPTKLDLTLHLPDLSTASLITLLGLLESERKDCYCATEKVGRLQASSSALIHFLSARVNQP